MKIRYLALGFALSCIVGSASAQLYGLSSDTPGTVYSVDEGTGAATAVTNVTGNVLTSIVDIEFLNGTAYACDVLVDSGWAFGTIDLGTGAFTQLNNQDGSANWWGLAAKQSANILYTVDFNDANNLKKITSSGTVTTIGLTGLSAVGAMTYDNVNGLLYATDGDGLYTLNEGTGAATFIGNLGLGGNNFSDLAYNDDLGVLYYTLNGNLYTVNTGTGAATLVGGLGVTVDGLGWKAGVVPEPASMAALGTGLMVLLRKRRKK